MPANVKALARLVHPGGGGRTFISRLALALDGVISVLAFACIHKNASMGLGHRGPFLFIGSAGFLDCQWSR